MNRYKFIGKLVFSVGQKVRPRDDYRKPWVIEHIYHVRSKMIGTVIDVLPNDKYLVLWNGKNKAFEWGVKYLKHE